MAIQEMEVRVKGREGLDVGAAANSDRLDHLAAGAPGGLRTEGRTLVPVELKHGELDRLRGVGDLIQRGVDEHSHHLQAPLHGDRDLGCGWQRGSPGRPRPEDQPDGPGARRGRMLGVLKRGDPAELDPGAHRDNRRAAGWGADAGGDQPPVRARQAASTSGARMSASPTRTASKPARSSSCNSAWLRKPDSATLVTPAGMWAT